MEFFPNNRKGAIPKHQQPLKVVSPSGFVRSLYDARKSATLKECSIVLYVQTHVHTRAQVLEGGFDIGGGFQSATHFSQAYQTSRGNDP